MPPKTDWQQAMEESKNITTPNAKPDNYEEIEKESKNSQKQHEKEEKKATLREKATKQMADDNALAQNLYGSGQDAIAGQAAQAAAYGEEYNAPVDPGQVQQILIGKKSKEIQSAIDYYNGPNGTADALWRELQGLGFNDDSIEYILTEHNVHGPNLDKKIAERQNARNEAASTIGQKQLSGDIITDKDRAGLSNQGSTTSTPTTATTPAATTSEDETTTTTTTGGEDETTTAGEEAQQAPSKEDVQRKWQTRSVWQAWKDGEFGDPNTKDAKQARNYFLLNSLATFAQNAAERSANLANVYRGGQVDASVGQNKSEWASIQEARRGQALKNELSSSEALDTAGTNQQIADTYDSSEQRAQQIKNKYDEAILDVLPRKLANELDIQTEQIKNMKLLNTNQEYQNAIAKLQKDYTERNLKEALNIMVAQGALTNAQAQLIQKQTKYYGAQSVTKMVTDSVGAAANVVDSIIPG